MTDPHTASKTNPARLRLCPAERTSRCGESMFACQVSQVADVYHLVRT